MQKTINVLSVVLLLIFVGLSAYSQNSISPFSRYGIGDLHHYAYGRTAAMGGATLGSRHSTQINTANPASYSSSDSLSFVIFDFGTDASFSSYSTSSNKLNTDHSVLRYFATKILLKKWLGAAIGIQPFSDMDYQFELHENTSTTGNVYHQYIGDGTSSKVFLGASAKLTKGLSVGANLNYYCGQLNQYSNFAYQTSDQHHESETLKTELRDFSLSYGLQYDFGLNNEKFLTLGLTLENETDLRVLCSDCSIQTITKGTQLVKDTTKCTKKEKSTLKLPSTLGIGLSYTKLNKFEFSADYYYAAWSNSTFYGQTEEYITNQSRISAGIEFTPGSSTTSSYFKRMSYRAGYHSGNTNLKLNNQPVKDSGISFGVGLPIPKSKSTANLAVEFGNRGNLTDNLIKEKYTKVSLYFTFANFWSRRAKTDGLQDAAQETAN